MGQKEPKECTPDEVEIDDSAVDSKSQPESQDELNEETSSSKEAVDEAANGSELAELRNRLLRTQADFDNYKRRSRAEMESLAVFANETLVKSLLPVLDNFERALSAGADSSDPIIAGVQLVKKQLFSALEKAGVKEIEAVGMKFDPNFHEAVMQVAAEEVEDDTIVEEFQKGYLLGSRVIRPSMVKVAKG